MLERIFNYFREEKGAIAPLAAIMLPLLLGVTGLGVDTSLWMMHKRDLQAAADAAVMSAGYELANDISEEESLTAAALRSAESNGYDSAAAGSQITVETTEVSPGVTQILVSLSEPDTTFFSGMVFSDGVTVQVTAASEVRTPTSAPCVMSLSGNASPAVQLDSNSEINLTGCSLQVNSDDDEALVTESNSDITADDVCVTGSVDQDGAISPAPTENCPAIADPFAALEAPPEAEDDCDYNNTVVNTGNEANPTELSPGVYCGGIEVRSNKWVIFEAGIYIIKDGPLILSSNSHASGDDVMFYFTGDDALVDFASNSEIDFTADTAGAYAGILFFQDRNYSGTHTLNSNVDGEFDGLIYFPSGHLDVDSNADLGDTPTCLQIVANTVNFDSNANLNITPDMENCSNYANYPAGITTVKLVL